MTVRIEAGSITEYGCKFKRNILVTVSGNVMEFLMVAGTKEVLEVIDHENFMKE